MSISFPLLNGSSVQANNNLATKVSSPIQLYLSARHRQVANYCAARRGKLRSHSLAEAAMIAGRIGRAPQRRRSLAFTPALVRIFWGMFAPESKVNLTRAGILEIVYSLAFLVCAALGFRPA
jgi:hypothetical protein